MQIVQDHNAKSKCIGEYESLRAIDSACPGFAPRAHAWGRMKDQKEEAYFLLEDFVALQVQVRSRV